MAGQGKQLVEKMEFSVKLPEWLRLQPRGTEVVKYPYTFTSKVRRFPWALVYKGPQARFMQCVFFTTALYLYMTFSTSIRTSRFPSGGHDTRFEPVGKSSHH